MRSSIVVLLVNFDPAIFYRVNVADTCTVWNVIASRRLLNAAHAAGCAFCITPFVKYEALSRPRSNPSAIELGMQESLRREMQRGRFQAHPCTLQDLQDVELLEQRRRLGKGELSTLALAMRMRQGFITDDDKATKLAAVVKHSPIQSTPHLLGWLIYTTQLADGEKDTIIADLMAAGRNLRDRLEDAYMHALACRLKACPPPEGA